MAMAQSAIVKQPPLVESKKLTYDGRLPAVQPTLRKIAGPLPLQPTAIDNLEWAYAFLDYTGHLVKGRERDYADLERKYNTERGAKSALETEKKSLLKSIADWKHKYDVLHGEYHIEEAKCKRLSAAFAHFREDANAEKAALNKKLREKISEVSKANARASALEKQLEKADKKAYDTWVRERKADEVDHEKIHGLEEHLKEEHAKNAKLTEKLNIKDQELSKIQIALKAAEDAKAKSDKRITELEEEVKTLKQQVVDGNRAITRAQADLAQSQEQNKTLNAEKDHLLQDLLAKSQQLELSQVALVAAVAEASKLKNEVSEQKQTIENLTKELDREQQENIGLRLTVETQLAKIKEQTAHDDLDDAKIAELQKQLALIEATLAGIAIIAANDKKLLDDAREMIKKLDALVVEQNKKLADDVEHDTQHHLEIKKLNDDLAAAAKKKSELEADLEKKKKNLIAATELAADLAKKDGSSDSEVPSLKEGLDAANKKIAELETALKEQLTTSKEQTEADSKALAEEKEKVKLLEARLRAIDSRPQLQHCVHLKNPIALIGSLKGAFRNVDDESFLINCPFPVNLFGTTSHEIYVSINGIFSLNTAQNWLARGTNYKLPYRGGVRGLPWQTLAPFWSDLYIYKDTPQGIYYEFTGKEGSRQLEVEWYVSRYSNKQEYYHFSLVVEEAKPGFATFKYFEVSDKGKKSTVGIQGPKTEHTFSYNEPKIVPGLQLTFDTNNKTSLAPKQSNFPLSASTAQPTAKTSDIKAANAVTATVAEIAP